MNVVEPLHLKHKRSCSYITEKFRGLGDPRELTDEEAGPNQLNELNIYKLVYYEFKALALILCYTEYKTYIMPYLTWKSCSRKNHKCI